MPGGGGMERGGGSPIQQCLKNDFGPTTMYGGEEATPFPAMPDQNKAAANKLDSQPPSRSESVERDGTAFFAQQGLDEDYGTGEGQAGIHPGEGGIFNFPSGGDGQTGPVRLTNLTPISPTNEDVYSSAELRSNPQPPIQVFSPSRQHVGYPFLFAPANPNIYGMNLLQPESDKFRKLMLKKQKRESRKPKNVLSEFKSEDISGHKFEDLDSVLQSLGEVKEEKKGKVKKGKVEKGKVSADGKKARRSVEKEVNSGEEDPEETIEAKETEEEEEVEEEVEVGIMKDAKVTTGRKNKQGGEVGSKASIQSGDLVGKELVDFQNNFNLVTTTSSEPGVLTKPRSQESLSVATEFTKVTKRHRGKKSKEEMANQQLAGQNQTGNKQPVANNPQTSRYAMRAREPQVINSMAPAAEPGMRHTSSNSSSPPGFHTSDFPSLSVGKFDFPSLGSSKSDFPSLGGEKPVSESSCEGTNNKLLATPWARVVRSDKAVNNCDRVTIVGKKWEPGNLVPSRFLGQIRKVE